MKFSPLLFLTLEFFMVFPSILFILGIVRYGLTGNILISIIGPFAGGFIAYNYLERYGVKGLTRKITKIILFYSIIEIGTVILFSLIS